METREAIRRCRSAPWSRWPRWWNAKPRSRTSGGWLRAHSPTGWRRTCSCTARGFAPGADGLSIFRGQHAGRALFRVNTGGTQQKCGQISPPAERGARGTSRGGSASYSCGRSDAQRQTMTDAVKHKKDMILDAARDLGVEKWTVAEIDQLRRKLLADHGEAGKTGNDYIADVLKAAGWKIQITEREEAEEQFEEEFEDILHFKTLKDAEVSLTRLDELLRRFRTHGERAAVERVLEIARLGKRRAEMISRNRKVEEQKRKEKKEIAEWFRIWLEAPDTFFDWLDVRKASPEFHATFGEIEEE